MNKEQFLAISLPHELKFYHKRLDNVQSELLTMVCLDVSNNDIRFSDGTWLSDNIYKIIPSGCESYCKPILRVLDLKVEIKHKGKTILPVEELLKMSGFKTSKMLRKEIMSYAESYSYTEFINFDDISKLIEWHFDIAGLIEKGEAIDVNTLPENPYK